MTPTVKQMVERAAFAGCKERIAALEAEVARLSELAEAYTALAGIFLAAKKTLIGGYHGQTVGQECYRISLTLTGNQLSAIRQVLERDAEGGG